MAALKPTPRVTIVGAGMSGSLMAIFLARRGFAVEVYEKRGDLRREPVDTGKSIKMTLAARGLQALEQVGLSAEVLRLCVPLRGRAVHSGDGTVTYQPYGKDEREVIYSISRSDLNALLLDRAEDLPGVRLHFHQKCVQVDRETSTAVFRDERTGAAETVEADAVIGADGAFSVVRQQMQRGLRTAYRQDFLAWGYKELTIAAGPNGKPHIDLNALHVWPCGDQMLFALPNLDGSFNGVCVLPFEGKHGFEAVRCDADVLALFRARFADALPLMPDLLEEFRTRDVSEFLTLRTSRWHHKGKVVLLGDCCHTVVPFYGQGMNAAFEDCSVLDDCLARHPRCWETAFAEYQALRKEHTDVLAQLSEDNFHELRDTVRSVFVTARKRASILLNRLFPRAYVPIYTLISHSTIPYAHCVERAQRQDRFARWLGVDLLVAALGLGILARKILNRSQGGRFASPVSDTIEWRSILFSVLPRGKHPAAPFPGCAGAGRARREARSRPAPAREG
jgi:kynurenine 3-monooxygenase